MADIKNSSKSHVYHSLARLNRAFNAVVFHIRNIEESGMFPILQMRTFSGLARELQSQISYDVLEKMSEIEKRECFRWGKVRIRWEHSLNPERPPFKPHR
jgi:hypothetical protein